MITSALQERQAQQRREVAAFEAELAQREPEPVRLPLANHDEALHRGYYAPEASTWSPFAVGTRFPGS